MPGRGRKRPLARLPVPGLSAFRFPTRLLAKAVQATVHFFTSLEVCKKLLVGGNLRAAGQPSVVAMAARLQDTRTASGSCRDGRGRGAWGSGAPHCGMSSSGRGRQGP